MIRKRKNKFKKEFFKCYKRGGDIKCNSKDNIRGLNEFFS